MCRAYLGYFADNGLNHVRVTEYHEEVVENAKFVDWAILISPAFEDEGGFVISGSPSVP